VPSKRAKFSTGSSDASDWPAIANAEKTYPKGSFMEPVIIGAIAGVVAVLITISLFRNGKAD
jgi:hypothetical protein